MAIQYQKCMLDMKGRSPGRTCKKAIRRLKPQTPGGYVTPFNLQGGGCGAAMRAAPIGLAYSRSNQIEMLVAVAIESARMSHNHPTGYLGSVATALFVAYAIQGKPLEEWGVGLLGTLDLAWKHIELTGRDVPLNRQHWGYFGDSWERYMQLANQTYGDRSGVNERDSFYQSLSFSGWGGSSGHDAPMIAYDALIGAGNSWPELCYRGMLHGGDSDSTGIICGACWGAMYGFDGVPKKHYRNVEYFERLTSIAEGLWSKSLM